MCAALRIRRPAAIPVVLSDVFSGAALSSSRRWVSSPAPATTPRLGLAADAGARVSLAPEV
jgi:hypothetical protein